MWADRRSWTLDEKLPDLLQELEIRAAEDDHREAEAKKAAAERLRRWEAAMGQAKARFLAHRERRESEPSNRWVRLPVGGVANGFVDWNAEPAEERTHLDRLTLPATA